LRSSAVGNRKGIVIVLRILRSRRRVRLITFSKRIARSQISFVTKRRTKPTTKIKSRAANVIF
jgi:hypothetical protein